VIEFSLILDYNLNLLADKLVLVCSFHLVFLSESVFAISCIFEKKFDDLCSDCLVVF